MSSQTLPTPAPARRRDGSGLTFGRVLRSEWIKVTTVPSTVILLIITLVVMVGLSALYAWQMAVSVGFIADASPEMQAQMGGVTMEDMREDAKLAPASGYIFGQLLIASLAVVLIASEWGTGMIRSTMVAVPKRIPALLAKNLVIAVVAFVLGAGAALVSYFIAQPILAAEDLEFALSDEGVWRSILNTGTYLALIAVISMAIGTLLRNTAGGVVTAIGLFFVVPVIVVNLIQGLADWIPDAARFLPTNAGDMMLALSTTEEQLTPLEGGLVMAAWAVVLLLASLLVTKRRDV